MTGVVVAAANDLAASHAVDRIKGRLAISPAKPLHWYKLNHQQRRVVVQEVTNEPIKFVSVCVDKPRLTQRYLRQPPALYWYATRYLMERISWYVDDQGGRVHLIFENRARFNYTTLNSYIQNLVTDPNTQVRNVIDRVIPLNKSQSKMLQVADSFASATYAAFEPDRYGNVDPTYLQALKHLSYRRRGRLFSYGLKAFPNDCSNLATIPLYQWFTTL